MQIQNVLLLKPIKETVCSLFVASIYIFTDSETSTVIMSLRLRLELNTQWSGSGLEIIKVLQSHAGARPPPVRLLSSWQFFFKMAGLRLQSLLRQLKLP